jgi:hypothetical protein
VVIRDFIPSLSMCRLTSYVFLCNEKTLFIPDFHYGIRLSEVSTIDGGTTIAGVVSAGCLLHLFGDRTKSWGNTSGSVATILVVISCLEGDVNLFRGCRIDNCGINKTLMVLS